MEPSTPQLAPAQPFAWDALVPQLVHPVKVAIIEAMTWIERPLTATDLDKVLRGQVGASLVSYHLRKLAELGVVGLVRQEPVRGAMRSFYSLRHSSS